MRWKGRGPNLQRMGLFSKALCDALAGSCPNLPPDTMRPTCEADSIRAKPILGGLHHENYLAAT